MAAFPTLRTGYCAKFPLTQNRERRTGVYIHTNLTEQRFAKGYDALNHFILVYKEIGTTDKETLRTFWNGRQGSLDSTWTLTLPIPEGSSTTWQGMQFVPGSTFEAQETSFGIWQITLQVRQTRLP